MKYSEFDLEAMRDDQFDWEGATYRLAVEDEGRELGSSGTRGICPIFYVDWSSFKTFNFFRVKAEDLKAVFDDLEALYQEDAADADIKFFFEEGTEVNGVSQTEVEPFAYVAEEWVYFRPIE